MLVYPFGTQFTIKFGAERETWVVHEANSDPVNGVISSASPLGRSLIQSIGSYKTPKGETIDYEILSVRIGSETYNPDTITSLRETIDNIHYSEIGASFKTPHLDEQDILLAQEWIEPIEFKLCIEPERIRTWSFESDNRRKGEYSRVLSARAAEKVAAQFYRTYGQSVNDISIQQLNGNLGSDWNYFDLLVNDRPVDVKNARRARHNPNGYVEHCIPKFKQSRDKQNVIIAGILSPYLWPEAILSPETSSYDVDKGVLFLGNTSIQDIETLKTQFSKGNLVQIIFSHSQKGRNQFLPPWIFNYRDFAYSSRYSLIDTISKLSLPEPDKCQQFHINPIPLLLSAGIDPIEYWRNINLTKWEQSFIRKILMWRTQRHLSLPAIFLSILTHFLEMMSSSQSIQNYLPQSYRKLIFTGFSSEEIRNPLLIYDPLCTISNLITSLDTLWIANHLEIRRYKVFKLQDLNILQGRHPEADSQWKTLIAYCGGWIGRQEKCGENPLILGKNNHCRECGRLICSRCGYCSNECSLYITRQHKYFIET